MTKAMSEIAQYKSAGLLAPLFFGMKGTGLSPYVQPVIKPGL